MPKPKKCCNSTKSDSNCVKSCVEHEIKSCKEKCCKAKYVKLAEKLLKTGLLVDSCTYNRDVFTNVVAGSKFEWLNIYLINNNFPTDFSPAAYGSENAFRAVDPTLNNYVFTLAVNKNTLLNPTSLAGTAVPIVQDVLEDILGVNNFGTDTLNEMTSIISGNSIEAIAYATVYIATVKELINILPVNQAIIGSNDVPLFVEAQFIAPGADGIPVNMVAKVGIIKKQLLGGNIYYIYGLGHKAC
jgi:hypothetical protein